MIAVSFYLKILYKRIKPILRMIFLNGKKHSCIETGICISKDFNFQVYFVESLFKNK